MQIVVVLGDRVKSVVYSYIVDVRCTVVWKLHGLGKLDAKVTSCPPRSFEVRGNMYPTNR